MNFIKVAREAVSNYSIVGNEEMIDLQHLLAVIIGARADSEICGELAKYGLKGLIDLSVHEMESLGLTHNEALRLHSALVLAKKLNQFKSLEERKGIRSPEDCYEILKDMRFLNQEHFVVLYLNTKNEVIKRKTVFIGSLNSAVVHPREVFNEALKQPCNAIIVAHNHPSGDPSPSTEDIEVTRRLYEVGRIVGISVLDSLIIGDNRYVSLKEKGYI